ncbi:DUF1684 domain-containing protein [Glaciihabitans sp. dw_435]|uniref:DUF1684 domain-containing protein n=1 Tax=Glaciihabitans sp. dw_435 TaxID=2720081 RepID=UPI001BD5165B|nr:DUF1684 domain-containing protein [Glaciihabitans sp. dw_435]
MTTHTDTLTQAQRISASPAPTGTADFAAEWLRWHARHEEQRADKHGFLAITGLHWLTKDPTRFDDAPGLWSTGEAGPVVELEAGESLVVQDAEVTGRYEFGVIAERGSRLASSGDAALEVARRGGHDILRPRHPEHVLRTEYVGTPTYAPDPGWKVEGRFVPFDQPREVTVGAAVEGLLHVYEAPGVVQVEIDGQSMSLTAFNGHAPGSLLVLFTDATSGITTYAANRALNIDAPDADGRVVVDFNRSTNLPCAYTDFATCPLPPAENRLAVAITAGEKIPTERGGAAS